MKREPCRFSCLFLFAVPQGFPQTMTHNPPFLDNAGGNIYEVNVRQYTEERTLNAFAKHLYRLKEMGVQTVWFMPINPISKVDRKGSLGSYYVAVSDYTSINPDFEMITDFGASCNPYPGRGMK